MDSRFNRAIKLFDQQRYYEAHDLLEEIWRELVGAEKQYMQGFVQICAALHLIKEERYEGAKTVFERAKKNLQGYQMEIFNIDLMKVLEDNLASLRA